ncbi:FAD-dependent oxidoreductase [Thermodesulfobacteriota bacterium]
MNVQPPEKFDAVIVGAGPAGATAAIDLARAGLSVLMFERGEAPGQKNMFGGVLHYSEALNNLVPDFWKVAPVERHITTYRTSFLTSDASLTMSFEDEKFASPPYNGFSLMRAKFDKWYAEKAEEAGALLVPETAVEDLLWENGHVVGVRTGRSQGDVFADCVILADGANSLLAKKAGLRKDLSPADFSVAAKEILTLPKAVIEERFQLSGNEGLAHIFAGDCTKGVEGGAFLYTNTSSLSIGVVAKLSALKEKQTSIADILEQFKTHPVLKPAIKDAILKEYSGHLIPEGGAHMTPKLFGNGVLLTGDAAGFVCSTGLTLEGMNFAMASGLAASETVKTAGENGNFSETGLASYQQKLEASFVLKDLKTFCHTPGFLANPNLYNLYPELACQMAENLYRVNGQPRKKMLELFKTEIKGKISIWRLIKDAIQGGRAVIWK